MKKTVRRRRRKFLVDAQKRDEEEQYYVRFQMEINNGGFAISIMRFPHMGLFRGLCLYIQPSLSLSFPAHIFFQRVEHPPKEFSHRGLA